MEISERLQSDNPARVVTLANLRAMCDRASGMCHRFWVESYSANRVKVGYSNPDEYVTDNPTYAIFPAWVDGAFGEKTLYVVLGHMIAVVNDPDGLNDQYFCPVTDCPTLWRSNPDTDDWKTREEIEAAKA